MVQAPASPASGIVAVNFNVIDTEKEAASIAVEFSTNGGAFFIACTLVVAALHLLTANPSA